MLETEKKSKNHVIDCMKGILILSVIVGHILRGSVRDTLSRYLIYSVHMPLFIMISGYLFHYGKNSNIKILSFLRKYWFRIGIPWVIAVNAYYIFVNFDNFKNSGLREILFAYFNAYINPWMHLWYVPSFFLFCLITYLYFKVTSCIFKNEDLKMYGYLLLAACITVAAYIGKNQKYKFYYFAFFALGIAFQWFYTRLTQKQWNTVFQWVGLGSIVLLVVRGALFYTDLAISEKISVYYYILNIPLGLVMLLVCEKQILPRLKLIEYIGRNSLPLYLWHILGRNIIIRSMGVLNLPLFYILNAAAVLLEIVLIYYGSKSRWISRYVLGYGS